MVKIAPDKSLPQTKNRGQRLTLTYDLFLRALPDVGTYEWEPTKRALDILRQAIERDPNFGKAMACAGYCHAVLDAIGKVETPEADRRIALDLARRALRTAGDDSMALACIAHVFGYFNEDIKDALAYSRPLDRSQSELVLGMAMERICPLVQMVSLRSRSSILRRHCVSARLVRAGRKPLGSASDICSADD